MTPERVVGLVARWVRFYTRSLPTTIAERRIDEIDADLHDHMTHERGDGTAEWRIALGITARMVRGLAADVSWRASNRKEAVKMSKPAHRSAVRVTLATGLILLPLLVASLVSDEMAWGLADFVLAGVLLAGAGSLIELAVRKPASLVYRVAAAALGIAAVVFGEADDAPGLVLFGGLLILGTLALTVRTALRS